MERRDPMYEQRIREADAIVWGVGTSEGPDLKISFSETLVGEVPGSGSQAERNVLVDPQGFFGPFTGDRQVFALARTSDGYQLLVPPGTFTPRTAVRLHQGGPEFPTSHTYAELRSMLPTAGAFAVLSLEGSADGLTAHVTEVQTSIEGEAVRVGDLVTAPSDADWDLGNGRLTGTFLLGGTAPGEWEALASPWSFLSLDYQQKVALGIAGI